MITRAVISGLSCPSCWQYHCNGNRSVCKQGADSLCPTWYVNRLGPRPKRLLLHLTFTENCSSVLFGTTAGLPLAVSCSLYMAWVPPKVGWCQGCGLTSVAFLKTHTHHSNESSQVHNNSWHFLNMNMEEKKAKAKYIIQNCKWFTLNVRILICFHSLIQWTVHFLTEVM